MSLHCVLYNCGTWLQGLEEASRLYFADGDAQAMIDMMLPLHEMLNSREPQTPSERQFINNYGVQLREAHALLQSYKKTKLDTALQRAWDTYYNVFRKINKDLHNMAMLHLADVAPELLDRVWSCQAIFSDASTEMIAFL